MSEVERVHIWEQNSVMSHWDEERYEKNRIQTAIEIQRQIPEYY